jgi:integrase
MAGKEKLKQGKLETFLGYYNNWGTRNGYSVAIHSFIDSIYGRQRKGYRVTADEKKVYSKLVDKYFSENRDHKEDLMQFAVSLQSRAPLTAQKTFSRIREFLAANDIELRSQDLKRIQNKLPKGGPRTIERDLDIETIRSILQHLDIKGKALVLVLASSGMRISEALSITLDDLDWKDKPVSIQIHGKNAKNGENRLIFISTEAAQAVQEWLKVRDAYLKAAQNKNNGFVKKGMAKPRISDDARLFPFSDQTASQMWDNALKKAGFFSQDLTTNRKQLHFHMFRKFFLSQVSLVISKEIPEVLAGHSGYLTDAYRRYTKKQLAEEYLKAEYVVTIQTPKEIHEIETEFKSRMQDQGVILERVVAENAELKSLILKQQEFTQKLHDEKEEMKQSLEEVGNLGLSLAKIVGIIQNNPEVATALRDGIQEWRMEILDGNHGPFLRDRLIQLDKKQTTG